jgi:hypothetical protein
VFPLEQASIVMHVAKKEDSEESSQVLTVFEIVPSILDIIKTAQDLGLEVNFSIAYRR